MRLPFTYTKLLLLLLGNASIPIGRFSSKQNRELLRRFIEENTLAIQPRRNTRYVYCPNPQHLRDYLREQHGIPDLDAYARMLQDEKASGSDGARYASDSKLRKGRVFPGFFLTTYLGLRGRLHGKEILLKPADGSWLYLVDAEHFEIDPAITIVGVENLETFRYIASYRHLFVHITPLFLLRYENNAYIDWLQSIPNSYLHFGDFDLSGLALYVTEFRAKLGQERCTYLIPGNIEELLAASKNRELFIKQQEDPRVKGLHFEDYPEIAELARLIMAHKTTVEQEVLSAGIDTHGF